jgi:hypothetical protein
MILDQQVFESGHAVYLHGRNVSGILSKIDHKVPVHDPQRRHTLQPSSIGRVGFKK